MKILFVFAQLFKIQSHWVWETVSIAFSVFLITGLTWSCIRMWKQKRRSRETGWKKVGNNTAFYGTLFINLVFVLSLIVHLSIVVYIANSKYTLRDFSFDYDELHQELLNIDMYDKNGNKVYTVFNNGVNRETVSLNEMPNYLKAAFVDTEDKGFYHHSGVSVLGYVRAVYNKVLHPSSSMNGGSTITQQLIKNVNGDMYNRNVLHKYQEALLSIVIENKYSKEEILEMYLNRIYLGNGNVYGVGAASKQYFGKKVSDLSLAESAYLGGLPQAPSSYTENLELGNKRKNIVLYAMKENGSITESQYNKAMQQKITLSKNGKSSSSSLEAYSDYVLKEAKADYGITEEDLKNKGYSIYTYLDSNFQNKMYQEAQNFTYKDDNNPQGKKVQVGMAAIDNNNGKVIALYGGRNYVRGNLNRSYNYYQPGSILKPLAVYTPAFESEKWNPYSTVIDEKKSFSGYSPKNAGEKYEGEITVERAIIRSANIPAVSVLEDIGVEAGANALKKLGISVQEKDKELHLALGGMEKGVTPIQMAQAYTVFPNYGYFEPAKAIKFIKDKNGNYIHMKETAKTKGKDVFTPENSFHMTEILQKVVSDENGTGQNANIGRPVAGKTGTAEEAGTSGNRASWFVGYTPDVTMSVHLGFDQPSSNLYLTTSGGDEPARLFSNIMKKALVDTPVKTFQKPEGVRSILEETALTQVQNVQADYDSKGKRVVLTWDKNKYTKNIVYKVFKKGKNGKDIEVGSTTNTTFNDTHLSMKQEFEVVPPNADWKERIMIFIKNIMIFIKNILFEHNTYYVVATYDNEKAPASDTDSAWVPKIKKENK